MLKLNKLELTSLKEYNAKKSTKTKQLDISNNLLTELEGIDMWSDDLTWLNASRNQIKGVKYLKNCLNVNVLNLSHNKITSIKHLNKLKSLNALILNNNQLKCLDGLSSLTELNTLILSSNNLEHVDVASLKQLQKFSASHNELKEFPLLQSQKDLKDLKLNNNKMERVPNWFVSSCIRIKTLDLGNNTLKDFDSIKCLCNLPYLENLNLKGNPLCDLEDYHVKMKAMFPKLKILDFKKLSDLYFKAIESQAKASQEPPVAKEKINEITETAANVNKIPEVVTDLSKGTDVCSKHGFKSKKVKRKDSDAEQPTDENNENVLCDSIENKTLRESKTSKKHKETEGNEHSKSNDKECDNSSSTEIKNSDDNTPMKKKKGKKRKHTSTDADSTPQDVKKNKENGRATVPDDSTKVDEHTSKLEGKKKKKKGEKVKKGDKKSSKKKTGVVGIIKTASRKKSKSFDHGDLVDSSACFGTGESDAWS